MNKEIESLDASPSLKVAAPGPASPKAAEPVVAQANGLCGAFPEGNDGDLGAAASFRGAPHDHEDFCVCCGTLHEMRPPASDPWQGRLHGYCDECATARCDAFPGECPVRTTG